MAKLALQTVHKIFFTSVLNQFLIKTTSVGTYYSTDVVCCQVFGMVMVIRVVLKHMKIFFHYFYCLDPQFGPIYARNLTEEV